MIKRYIELKQQIAALTAEADTIKHGWLAELSPGYHEMDGHTLTIATRTRIDLDKTAVLTAVGPEAYKNLEKISEYTIVQVK